ncbi:hypothetical protein I307_04858 [Cryptococcus deuterogattii 99/473]|uniref:Unplaced genomic scaffold supercont1.9, whole genome shotgun sequence n=1 Tax=Cryptococcus deuterogattii Ram5 TaxID=1296110 RepID=A0A0D0T2W3_9TREE|nr:hypothetical protein I313_03963 [Cryptococcus deuterogattii Ram5]KIY55673.1 hypothetical protein I307_04858 [Cryptococcus deuterogattii 99/473]
MPLPSVGPNKRPAPITSSAFAFSLGTPKQKRPKASGKTTSSSVNPPPPPSPNSQQKARNENGQRDATLQTPFRRQYEQHGTSSKETSASKARATTPSINSNDDLTSDVRQYLSPAPLKVPRRTAGGSSKLQPLSLHTPSRRSQEQESVSKPKSLRRVTEQLDQLPLKKEESTEAKVALQATRLSGKVTEDLAARKRTILVDDEQEIGVSPNGKKITKWSGKGHTPSSLQLANLLSSSKASTHLFYTSMQNILNPSHRGPRRSRSKYDGDMDAITPIQHIRRAAPIRLKPLSCIPGPTHHCSLFWCKVLKWSSSELTQVRGQGEKVLLVLQPFTADAPRMGVDPQLMMTRMKDDNNTKNWLVGIWLCSEIQLPIYGQDMEEGRGVLADAASGSNLCAVFGTRYLIAEDD